jgi:ubiquinone/menaquinone biosynthesis C-methylase UbiE
MKGLSMDTLRGCGTSGPTDSSWTEKLSYPELVALSAQDNGPPGGCETIHWWIEQGRIAQESVVLDLACSTGFASRTIASCVGCTTIGIDVAFAAVAAAVDSSAQSSASTFYLKGDAHQLPLSDASVTHVVAGACFGFFKDAERVTEEVSRVLFPDGLLCVDTFCYHATPPEPLLRRVKELTNTQLSSSWDERHWVSVFEKRFNLECIERKELCPESVGSLAAKSFIPQSRIGLGEDALDDLRRRLLFIRAILNEHRRYQSASRQIWRLRK